MDSPIVARSSGLLTRTTSAPNNSSTAKLAGFNPSCVTAAEFRTRTQRNPSRAHIAAVTRAWFDFTLPLVITTSTPSATAFANTYSSLRTLLPPNPGPV